jgi:DNA polymerase III subunit delta
VAPLKPAYLVSGDDDAKIDSWRARVRRRAEEEHGPGGLEVFDARAIDPEEVSTALAALTFDPGVRYLLVDDAGCWKAGDLKPLETTLADLPPDTVLVLIVRGKPLKALRTAVEKAGGEVRDCAAPKAWELPKWAVERALELGIRLDSDAAKELVSRVGTSQQRLSRELEKLSIALHPSTSAGVEEVEALASGDGTPQAYDLADALVAGDLRRCLALAEQLEAHGERAGRLVYPIVRRLREVHRAVSLIEAGMPEQKVAGALGMPPWLAKRTVSRARQADRPTLERALKVFADLEVDMRGGGHVQLDEGTAFTLALSRAA